MVTGPERPLWTLIGGTLMIGRSAAVKETRRLAPPMATAVDVRGKEPAVSAGDPAPSGLTGAASGLTGATRGRRRPLVSQRRLVGQWLVGQRDGRRDTPIAVAPPYAPLRA
ncbi:hypothetical protein BCD49_11215 [Pseudofrankia sp. EUN1h]|nr:hypothetical protein BCD49_11215 [Pseudofrankia sp. EUN1h]